MPDRIRVRLAVAWLGSALALATVAPAPGPASAQPPADDGQAQPRPQAKLIFYKNRAFRIPVTVQPEVRSLVREVRLWVSDDGGRHWREFNQTSPDQPEFPFKASRDGEYWFALQTVDKQGRIYPSDDREAEPSLRVVVDTAPPTITLDPVGRQGSLAAVKWEVRDENLLANSFALEYQIEGAGPQDWRAVPLRNSDIRLDGTSRANFKLVGSKTWDAGTADPIRVRATVKDRAGNVREVVRDLGTGLSSTPPVASVNPRDFDAPPPVAPISARSRPDEGEAAEPDDPFAGLDTSPGAPPLSPGVETVDQPPPSRGEEAPAPAPAVASPTGDRTLLAGNPRFSLQYEVEDAGPSGVAKVQLWVTHDGGRTWYPQPEDTDRTSPYDADVGGEGTFGLWLVVQGASGLGDPPPSPNDRPQLWVEVDSTPPVVQADPPRPGAGAQFGKVLITWRASDPHLAPRPVTLSYRAEGSASAPWTPIAGPIENTGQYIWAVPPGVPPRFRVKIEVEDSLGHRGAAETAPVLIDRARPKGRIIGLDPAARAGTPDARR